MKRRILAAAIAAMMLAGSLTGCGGDSPAPAPDADSAAPGAPAEEGAQSPVKIVVYNNSGSIAGAGSEAGADPAIMEQIHQWMLENTGYVYRRQGHGEADLIVIVFSVMRPDAFFTMGNFSPIINGTPVF